MVYAGRKLKSGNWSCSILASKSKLIDATIPRNELSAILLYTELAFFGKTSSWRSSRQDSLLYRLFVYNRVMTILRMCE